MFACFALAFIPMVRLLWIRRWPPTRFQIAYVAMINNPGQIYAASKRACWNLWVTSTVLTALLALDLVLIFTVAVPHQT
jgi:hypothetical protein